MRARGWRGKLAKRRGYEQSFFEHSLIEMDRLLEFLPLLGSPSSGAGGLENLRGSGREVGGPGSATASSRMCKDRSNVKC